MPAMSEQEIVAVAAKLMRAIEEGDVALARTCYAPDARIWHNYDEKEQTPEENLATLEWVIAHLVDRRYEIVFRHAFPGGYVQQHVMHGTLPNGTAFHMPACLVCKVSDGRITRLDEYLDMGQAAALRTS